MNIKKFLWVLGGLILGGATIFGLNLAHKEYKADQRDLRWKQTKEAKLTFNTNKQWEWSRESDGVQISVEPDPIKGYMFRVVKDSTFFVPEATIETFTLWLTEDRRWNIEKYFYVNCEANTTIATDVMINGAKIGIKCVDGKRLKAEFSLLHKPKEIVFDFGGGFEIRQKIYNWNTNKLERYRMMNSATGVK